MDGNMSPSELIVQVGELPGRYKTILIFIFIFEDVLNHHFVFGVIRKVAVFFKLLLQELFHLKFSKNIDILFINIMFFKCRLTYTQKKNQTSCLESFQSSSRSISLKDSCDLGPFRISMSSMSKIKVLLGGILPVIK